jgi:RimJ/RimL family protein N-acetyltransferase
MAGWIGEGEGERPRQCWTAADEAGLPVGHFQLAHDPVCQTVRIARFAVAPARRGSGLGAQLMARMLRMAFADLGAFRVELGVASFNHGARRLYERFGFAWEGTHRASARVAGERWSVDTMSLLRPEWVVGGSRAETAA